jgi:four helix bundle protein
MATIERFEDLKAWQKARELAREVYQLCESGALGNDFNLRNNLCRAATHCMSKIAEGYALRDRQLFAGQLDQARGAGVSVQSLLYVALDTHTAWTSKNSKGCTTWPMTRFRLSAASPHTCGGSNSEH